MEEYEACILGLNMAVDRNIQELLVIGDSDLLVYQVQGEQATRNSKILPYLHHVQELRMRFTKIELRHVPRIQNEFADALATLSSMIQHPDKNYIDPIPVKIHNHPAYCAHVEEETDGKPRFHNIKEYLSKGEYPEHANHTQKRTFRRLFNHFFHRRGNLYRRTPDLGLLRCVGAKEASKLLEDVYVETCGPHMNVPPNELNATSSPWPFAVWVMDVIGPIEHTASNGHRFILVAIDYFTKWVEATSYKAVTKKVVADFFKERIVCRFGVPESIITDNAANLNSDLIKNIVRTSTRATPYMLVYGTEALIPAEVEIPSLRIIQEAELSDAELIRSRYEQLTLIDGKRMNTVCHGQLYQNRMSKAFNKRIKLRQFAPGQLVLKKIFLHQDEAKRKFSPN
ncbi:uncharacterized protein [Nicotiana sylvestris]|uniref:uncharacterized protein n=1 Tax=Nicotiana sylvestris TaxID=4096 RepID=UPI00388CE675